MGAAQACPGCGRPFYHNAAPCSAVLVEDAGRVLLARRAVDPGKDLWDLPGGFCEPGETPEEGAVRELREETGADIEVTGFLAPRRRPYGPGGDPTLNCVFRARLVGDAVLAAADDVAELRWFATDELPARDADRVREHRRGAAPLARRRLTAFAGTRRAARIHIVRMEWQEWHDLSAPELADEDDFDAWFASGFRTLEIYLARHAAFDAGAATSSAATGPSPGRLEPDRSGDGCRRDAARQRPRLRDADRGAARLQPADAERVEPCHVGPDSPASRSVFTIVLPSLDHHGDGDVDRRRRSAP